MTNIDTITILMLAPIVVGCIFYLKNLQDTLKAIRIDNRKIKPQKVWMILFGVLLNLCFAMPAMTFRRQALENHTPSLIATMLTIIEYTASGFIVIVHFIIVIKVSKSIKAEYNSRGIPIKYKPAYHTGMIMCICQTIASLFGIVPFIGLISIIAAFASFIFWIIYWVKTSDYKKKLRALPTSGEEDSVIFKDLY